MKEMLEVIVVVLMMRMRVILGRRLPTLYITLGMSELNFKDQSRVSFDLPNDEHENQTDGSLVSR